MTIGAGPVCGVVLAGGESRRMGCDKASMRWGRGSMLATVAGVLRARLDTVIVVARPGRRLPEGMGPGIVAAQDSVAGQGPLRGLEAGLGAGSRMGFEWAVTVATDMPLLTVEVVDRLTGAAQAPPRPEAVVAVVDGADQPLAAVYRTALAGRIDGVMAAGESSLRGFLGALDVRRVPLAGAAATAVGNLNTPEDVRRARGD